MLSPVVEEVLKPEYDCLFGVACADLREPEVQKGFASCARIMECFDPIRRKCAGQCLYCCVAGPHRHEDPHGTLELRALFVYMSFFQDGVAKIQSDNTEYSVKSVLQAIGLLRGPRQRSEGRRGMD